MQANLPLLQRELLHCSRIAKISPQQFLTHNEHILFDPNHTPFESQETDFNENGKRKLSPDRYCNMNCGIKILVEFYLK